MLLTRRNTRRYGGYIIHFGIVVMFIGIAGGAFNQAAREGDGLRAAACDIGPYHLVCQSITQDSKPKYDTDYALLDVYRNGKYVTQLAPEKRVYFAGTDHEQASTMVAHALDCAVGSLHGVRGQESGYGTADHQGHF